VSVLPLPLLAGLGAAFVGLAVTVSMLGRH
jgi:hypothetical protein